MANKVHCSTHGEREEAYVCKHLAGSEVGLGFHRNDPTSENPFPDAWCDDCEQIRATCDGWNERSEGLVEISLLCSGCYNDARIRHTRASVTFDDLSSLRWKCHSCEEWHTGPCLDFGFDAPHYWSGEHQEETASAGPAGLRTFLTENYCAIDDRDFFVRGLIRLPIIGTTMSFCWGVWGSLSRANFQALREKHDDPERIELPPMFSWLSSRIPVYPETLSIKMHVRVRPPGERPHFELELTDHPLAQEYHHGITPERVKEIMANILRETQSGC